MIVTVERDHRVRDRAVGADRTLQFGAAERVHEEHELVRVPRSSTARAAGKPSDVADFILAERECPRGRVPRSRDAGGQSSMPSGTPSKNSTTRVFERVSAPTTSRPSFWISPEQFPSRGAGGRRTRRTLASTAWSTISSSLRCGCQRAASPRRAARGARWTAGCATASSRAAVIPSSVATTALPLRVAGARPRAACRTRAANLSCRRARARRCCWRRGSRTGRRNRRSKMSSAGHAGNGTTEDDRERLLPRDELETALVVHERRSAAAIRR